MLSYYQYSIILETFHFDSNNMFPFGFLLKNGANLASSSSIRQQLFSKTTSGGRWQRDINISYFKTLKNMLTCRSVWGFECFVSILCFKIFIHFSLQQTYQKMNHNYFLYLRCFLRTNFCIFDVLLLSALFFLGFQIMVLYQITVLYKVLYVPNKWWCCTTHDVSGPNHGAGPHQYVELHSGYYHFPYGLLKTKKISKNIYQKISRNLEKPKKKLKNLFPGSLGQDMSVARVAENSKGDRTCLDEICAKWNAYMCLQTPQMFINSFYIKNQKTKKTKQTKKTKKTNNFQTSLENIVFFVFFLFFFVCLFFLFFGF